jgi:hypothetical protein
MQAIALVVGVVLMWPALGFVLRHAEGERTSRDVVKTALLCAVAAGLFAYGATGLKDLPTGFGGRGDSGVCGSGPTSYDC